jgi:hypothetical protein
MAEMIAGARQWIDLPDPEPLRGGVLSVARVIDAPDPHALMGVQAQTDACAEIEMWTQWCDMTPATEKTFEGAKEVVVGDPFALYVGVACDLQRIDEAQERARRRFGFAESRSLDAALYPTLETLADDLATATLGVAQGIGAAEAYAATFYGGAPTLLIPRQFAGCACQSGALKTNLDGTLTTCAGSKVGLITAPVTLPFTDASSAEIYVTGQIVLLRGEMIAKSVPQQVFDDGTFAPARALAERLYVPVFDCLVAKVAVACS